MSNIHMNFEDGQEFAFQLKRKQKRCGQDIQFTIP